MNCPVCEERLRSVDRFGVQIDVCPDCKWIWLDRGELEKIIEMAGAPQSAEHGRNAEGAVPFRHGEHDDPDDHEDEADHGRYREDNLRRGRSRRGSWLTDVLGGLGGGEE